MRAKTGFDAAIERAQHLLKLYEVLCDTRYRAVKSDWSRRFKKFMNWPLGQQISRVDGQGSLLILRESSGIQRRHFAHDYLSELLRFSIVAAISALDRYLHDLVTDHSWKLLRKKEEDVPKKLRDFKIRAIDVRKAVDRARKQGSRPGALVKTSIQRQLHREFTFQGSNQVTAAAKLLGIDNFWGKVAAEMGGAPTAGEIQDTLNRIARRRHRIVHEADLIVKSRAKPRLRDIDYATAEIDVLWIEELVEAINTVVDAEL